MEVKLAISVFFKGYEGREKIKCYLYKISYCVWNQEDQECNLAVLSLGCLSSFIAEFFLYIGLITFNWKHLESRLCMFYLLVWYLKRPIILRGRDDDQHHLIKRIFKTLSQSVRDRKIPHILCTRGISRTK